MSIGPTAEQTRRMERAKKAASLLSEDHEVLRMIERRALRGIREARTPDEAWEARALLVGHDEVIGLLALLRNDKERVEAEIGREEARHVAEQLQIKNAEKHEQYLRDAATARGKV